jgi:hypothetical protein
VGEVRPGSVGRGGVYDVSGVCPLSGSVGVLGVGRLLRIFRKKRKVHIHSTTYQCWFKLRGEWWDLVWQEEGVPESSAAADLGRCRRGFLRNLSYKKFSIQKEMFISILLLTKSGSS